MHVGHIVRRQQHDVVARRVEPTVGSIDYLYLGQYRASLRVEVLDHEAMLLWFSSSRTGHTRQAHGQTGEKRKVRL